MAPVHVACEMAQRVISRPAVAVIVVNYNNWGDTRATLVSLESALRDGDHVILVDNGSPDDPCCQAAEWFQSRSDVWCPAGGSRGLRFSVLRLAANVGFGRGCNEGIRRAPEYEYYWLLNNDTEVHDTTVDELIRVALEHSDAGFVGSQIYVWPERECIWGVGGRADRFTGDTAHFVSWDSSHVGPVDYVSGCSVLVRGDVFRRVGCFNPAFFLYYEETELQLRARRAGFRAYVAPRSLVGHKVGDREGVTPLRAFHTMRSQVLFLALHGVMRPVGVPYAVARRIGAHIFRRRFHAVLPSLKGALSGLAAIARARREPPRPVEAS